MLIYVVSAFFFERVAFWRPIFGIKLGEEFGRKKMRCGVVWGGEGRRINKTGCNVLTVLNMLNVSLHCFDKQN